MKKKGKTIYAEPIYAGEPIVGHGHIWIKAPWRKNKAPKSVKFTHIDMPSIVIAWMRGGKMNGMHHQSLQ
jgi:hypothetical protein